VVGASVPAIGGDVPGIVGRVINPIARVFLVARPSMALVSVPRHARVDDNWWAERRVTLHPFEDLGVVMVGALEPGVSRHGRDDGESGRGERVLHVESVIEAHGGIEGGGVERLKAVLCGYMLNSSSQKWVYVAGTLGKECEVGEQQVKT
jgi:hypothetical protein